MFLNVQLHKGLRSLPLRDRGRDRKLNNMPQVIPNSFPPNAPESKWDRFWRKLQLDPNVMKLVTFYGAIIGTIGFVGYKKLKK